MNFIRNSERNSVFLPLFPIETKTFALNDTGSLSGVSVFMCVWCVRLDASAHVQQNDNHQFVEWSWRRIFYAVCWKSQFNSQVYISTLLSKLIKSSLCFLRQIPWNRVFGIESTKFNLKFSVLMWTFQLIVYEISLPLDMSQYWIHHTYFGRYVRFKSKFQFKSKNNVITESWELLRFRCFKTITNLTIHCVWFINLFVQQSRNRHIFFVEQKTVLPTILNSIGENCTTTNTAIIVVTFCQHS